MNNLNPVMFSKALDRMLGKIIELSDKDISDKVLSDDTPELSKPLASVKITKVSKKPLDDNTCDDDVMSQALNEIEGMTGDKPDLEFIEQSGRNPKDVIKQLLGEDDDEEDDSFDFPENKLSKILRSMK